MKRVFDKVEAEQGRLDLLVNNAFRLGPGAQLSTKFWEQGVSTESAMFTTGVSLSAYCALPCRSSCGQPQVASWGTNSASGSTDQSALVNVTRARLVDDRDVSRVHDLTGSYIRWKSLRYRVLAFATPIDTVSSLVEMLGGG